MDQYILKGTVCSLPQESFGNKLLRSLYSGGSKIAMVDAESGRGITYEEILKQSKSLAQNLEALGFNSEYVMCVCSANSLHYPIPLVAALYLGIAIAPLGHMYTPRELIHSMSLVQPKIIFCSSGTLEKIMKAAEEVEGVVKIVVLDQSTDLPESISSLEEYLHLPDTLDFQVTPVDVDHVAAIMFSSGTTGVSKGVMLTHKNIHASSYLCTDPDFAVFHSNKVASALMPFHHVYGFIALLHMLSMHMQMIVLVRFQEQIFLNAIQQYKITSLFTVPSLMQFLANSPLVLQYDVSSVEEVFCGAAPLENAVYDRVKKRLGCGDFRQLYGMTETTAAVTATPPNSCKGNSVGRLCPNMELRIRDVSTDKTLGPNCVGEVCLRGDMVMKGYVGNPKATAEVLDSEGWLLTGDAGYHDGDGNLYIVDRYKELIKYKGHQVAPAEIEAILLKHPQISDCGVVGKPDSTVGQVPVAFVVKAPDTTVSEKDIVDFVAENVSHHKRLRGGVRFVKEIPKNATGKILRRLLREQLNVNNDS